MQFLRVYAPAGPITITITIIVIVIVIVIIITIIVTVIRIIGIEILSSHSVSAGRPMGSPIAFAMSSK